MVDYKYLSEEIVLKIECEFRESVKHIFKKNLCFAFIFGGFGKGYATQNHDIDMFIVLYKLPSKRKIEKFRKWYFNIHEKYLLKPDLKFPGEIIELKYLEEKIEYLLSMEFKKKFETYEEYEAIIFGDALYEKKIGVIVNGKEFDFLVNKSKKLFNSWKKEIYKELLYYLNIDELDSLDLRRLFKKIGVKYLEKNKIQATQKS